MVKLYDKTKINDIKLKLQFPNQNNDELNILNQLPKFIRDNMPKKLELVYKPKIIEHEHYMEYIPSNYTLNPNDYLSLLCISDTHGKEGKTETLSVNILPKCDVLLHAGDFTMDGRKKEVKRFNKFGQTLHESNKFKRLITIAGNHETTFDIPYYNKKNGGNRFHRFFKPKPGANYANECKNIIINSKYWTYLEDSSIIIDGVKIYGSPYQPEVYKYIYASIYGYMNCDILISFVIGHSI